MQTKPTLTSESQHLEYLSPWRLCGSLNAHFSNGPLKEPFGLEKRPPWGKKIHLRVVATESRAMLIGDGSHPPVSAAGSWLTLQSRSCLSNAVRKHSCGFFLWALLQIQYFFFAVVIVASFKYSLTHILNLKLLFLSMSQKGNGMS